MHIPALFHRRGTCTPYRTCINIFIVIGWFLSSFFTLLLLFMFRLDSFEYSDSDGIFRVWTWFLDVSHDDTIDFRIVLYLKKMKVSFCFDCHFHIEKSQTKHAWWVRVLVHSWRANFHEIATPSDSEGVSSRNQMSPPSSHTKTVKQKLKIWQSKRRKA